MPKAEKETKKLVSKKSRVLKFPDGFLWGAATSAYQVEGGIENNDWAVSSRVPPAGAACKHYHRYEADFQLAKKLNHNAHRLSLEWSRLEPQEDHWDENALEHYYDVLECLKKQGFRTFVTLHHFTNPVWFAAGGGWLAPQAPEQFAAYVAKIAQTLGQFIDFWITINEPDVYALSAYAEGIFPPFYKHWGETWRVFSNLLQAHNRAYELIHAYYPQARVGFAQNIIFTEAARPGNFFDERLVRLVHFFNVTYPYRHTQNDFLAVNHYFYKRLKFTWNLTDLFYQESKLTLLVSDRGVPIYPPALYNVLLNLRQSRLPIYITENGLADAGDTQRSRYIADYLGAVCRAIKAGVDVRGYLYWSLLDNFEWEDGYRWKYGLVAVDFATQRRTVRKSARVFARICKNNALEY